MSIFQGIILLKLLKMHLDEASLSYLLKRTTQHLFKIDYLRITQLYLIFSSLQWGKQHQTDVIRVFSCWKSSVMLLSRSSWETVLTAMLRCSDNTRISNVSLSNNEGKKKNNFVKWITLFCAFLCRRCTTTTRNCLISRCKEDVTTRQRPTFSFPELW